MPTVMRHHTGRWRAHDHSRGGRMMPFLSPAASMLGLALVLLSMADAQAAELQVLAGGAMTGPLRELGAQFERASGHKVVFRFGTTPELIKLATTGGPFDLGVVPREVLMDASARARFAAGAATASS